MSRYAHLAYTPNVREIQHQMGSHKAAGHRLAQPADDPEPLTAVEAAFIGGLDGFMMATVGETGWPYMQFRGGPPGFVHILDEQTLAFAEVRGNRQYITTGNLRGEKRVALFFLDHARQARLKLYGHATSTPALDDPELAERLASPRTDGRVERLMTVQVEAFDWNCTKHITPRFSEAELAEALAPIRGRLAQLDDERVRLSEESTRLAQENAQLRAELQALRGA